MVIGDREADRQTGRQSDSQTGRQADMQRYKETVRRTERDIKTIMVEN